MARLPVALACLALGVAVGLASVAVHALWWGLLLALAATAAVLVALPGGWWARLAFALGWVGVLALATPERPEGDYVVAGDVAGYTLLFSGLVVLASGFVGLFPRSTPGEDSGTVHSGT